MNKISVNTALQVWVLFLIVFFLLQYPAILSILFGAIAGLAAGLINTLLKAANQSTDTPDAPTEAKENAFVRARRHWKQWRVGGRGGEISETSKGWGRRRRTLRSRRKS